MAVGLLIGLGFIQIESNANYQDQICIWIGDKLKGETLIRSVFILMRILLAISESFVFKKLLYIGIDVNTIWG